MTDIRTLTSNAKPFLKWAGGKGQLLSQLEEYCPKVLKTLYNPNFNCTEFDTIRNAAGSNNFVLSVKAWIERTGAIGIMAKAGRYGGTYAHRDIAYHFGMWISPRFQLLLVKEYQRLKADEQKQLAWSAKRELSKINYRIHTDAIKSNLILAEVTREHNKAFLERLKDIPRIAAVF